MNFVATPLADAYVVETKPRSDERGYFARVFCAREFRNAGLVDTFLQTNHSRSELPGTIRGLHYQVPPHSETKLVRCTRGAVYDVFVDMRRDSATFLDWFGIELTESSHKMVYVPAGFAHGFQSLQPASEVTYQSSHEYSPEHERQLRFDDPKVGIAWPIQETIVSPKDATASLLTDEFEGVRL